MMHGQENIKVYLVFTD